jgi:hypothetical protein
MGIVSDSFGQDRPESAGGQFPPASGMSAALSPPAPASSPVPAAQDVGRSQDDGRSELRRRRDELAEQVTELHWDLGGLAYEMAIRDHFRLDVLVRRAALLQERDAELAEVERLLRMEQGGVAGNCASCAAPHSRGALYCWQCGTVLMERQPSANAAGVQDGATAVMDALLAHPAGTGSEPAASSDE